MLRHETSPDALLVDTDSVRALAVAARICTAQRTASSIKTKHARGKYKNQPGGAEHMVAPAMTQALMSSARNIDRPSSTCALTSCREEALAVERARAGAIGSDARRPGNAGAEGPLLHDTCNADVLRLVPHSVMCEYLVIGEEATVLFNGRALAVHDQRELVAILHELPIRTTSTCAAQDASIGCRRDSSGRHARERARAPPRGPDKRHCALGPMAIMPSSP